MSAVLIVLTSHTILGDTGKETGYYFDEMAAPYYAAVDAGHTVSIASIAGGNPTYDPASVNDDPTKNPAPVVRFMDDAEAMAKLQGTPAIGDINPADYDAIFLAGGHGTMFDFPDSEQLSKVVSAIWDGGGVVSAVCHGPAGLVKAVKADGTPLVAGLRVSGFTDSEEDAVGLSSEVPFLLEARLRELGGKFEGGENWVPFAVRDGRLVTGQNPASAAQVGSLIVEALAERLANN